MQSNKTSSAYSILVFLLIKSLLLLVYTLAQSAGFVLSTALSLKFPLEVVLLSLVPPMSDMQFTLSPLGKLILQFKSPKNSER